MKSRKLTSNPATRAALEAALDRITGLTGYRRALAAGFLATKADAKIGKKWSVEPIAEVEDIDGQFSVLAVLDVARAKAFVDVPEWFADRQEELDKKKSKYLDLQAKPKHWFKVEQSGANWHVYGRALFGMGPRLVFPLVMSMDQVEDITLKLAGAEFPALVESNGEQFTATIQGDMVVVAPFAEPAPAPALAPTPTSEDVAADVAASLGCFLEGFQEAGGSVYILVTDAGRTRREVRVAIPRPGGYTLTPEVRTV